MSHITAKDLLLKLLDYECRWTLPHNISSKPATIRLQQMEHLQEVFGLTKNYVNPLINTYYDIHGKYRVEYLSGITNLQYVQSGEFLKDRDESANQEVLEKAISVIRPLYPTAPTEYFYRRGGDIGNLFSELLEFRKEIYKLTHPEQPLRSGFSVGALYSNYLKDEVRQTVINSITEIDYILALILDPQKRIFAHKEIGLEELNMEQIDLEWWATQWT